MQIQFAYIKIRIHGHESTAESPPSVGWSPCQNNSSSSELKIKQPGELVWSGPSNRGNGIVVNTADNQNHYKIIDHHHPSNDCLHGHGPRTVLRSWMASADRIVRDRGEKKMPVTSYMAIVAVVVVWRHPQNNHLLLDVVAWRVQVQVVQPGQMMSSVASSQ